MAEARLPASKPFHIHVSEHSLTDVVASRSHMVVSIVICTWNRCASLRRTLASLCALDAPAGQRWEVIVVDNASSDATEDVIASFQGRLPIRRVLERELGLSRARNTGVAAATGDLLLFTDDDVEVDRGCMTAYVDAAARWPDAGYFGGRIHAVFDADVPQWVRRHKEELRGMLCTLDLGPESRPLGAREFPYGPNMAIRPSAMLLAPFDSAVGRRGKGQVRGSEDSVFRALERQGICGVWVPEARVGHRIPASRATLRYLWQYYHGSGRGGARLDYPATPHWRTQLPRALRSARKLLTDRRQWPRNLAALAKETGRLRESVFARGGRGSRDDRAELGEQMRDTPA